MPYCRIHGLHTSQSGCPDCRYAEYKQQKLVEKLEGSPNTEATPSRFDITSSIEDLGSRLGIVAGALCGGIFGFVGGFKDGGIGWGLLVGAVGAIICAILGGVIGAFLGGLLPLAILGMLIYVVLRLLAAEWFMPSSSRRPAAINAKTHALAPGETLVLEATDDVILTAPAGMRKGACIYRAPSVRYFWSDGASGEVLTAANCNGVWRTEGPRKSIHDGRLLNSIGVWNPTSRAVTLALHSRP